MSAKEYLRQAFFLDLRIHNKAEQLEKLKDLVTSLGGNISGMPRGGNSKGFCGTVDKIVDLQLSLNKDIEVLVELKQEIVNTIEKVEDTECRVLLEMRYLNYKTWEQIALDMHYGIRNVHYLHGEALKKVVVP